MVFKMRGWGGKSGQEPLCHGLQERSWRWEDHRATHTGAEPVINLLLVVHLHLAYEVEVPDLPGGTLRSLFAPNQCHQSWHWQRGHPDTPLPFTTQLPQEMRSTP